MENINNFDTIIIGAGPAGITAGIYLARAGITAILLEKEAIGGQIATSPLVENYPGYSSISGSELADRLYEQVSNLGVEIEIEEAKNIEKIKDNLFKVVTDYNEYICKTIIIATGSKYRILGIENEENLIGKGIHFCTSCDAAFYKGKVVAVVGGANSAVTNAIYLADICKKVYLIYRKDKLRCENKLEQKLKEKQNVEILYNTNIIKFIGDNELKKIEIEINAENKSKIRKTIEINGVFEAIGMDAQTEIANKFLKTDDEKYFISEDGTTKIPGIFVAGDCREKKLRQVTTATSDGAIAANEVIQYLKN